MPKMLKDSMVHLLDIFILWMCFLCVQSEECSGITLGKTACIPQEYMNTIHVTQVSTNQGVPCILTKIVPLN